MTGPGATRKQELPRQLPVKIHRHHCSGLVHPMGGDHGLSPLVLSCRGFVAHGGEHGVIAML
jgi:hypothetical protein